jgi:F0F1-type ATP synthase assembly protein I
VGLGIIFGRYLDRQFNTAPVLFLCGFAIGFGAAVKSVVIAVRNAMKETTENELSQPKKD